MPSNVLARLPQNHSGKPSLLAAAVVLAFSGNLNAAGLPTLQEVTVSSASHDLTGFADLATEGTVTAKQLANRPLLRPAEVLETIPGMVVTQHSGDGKANQYFLRGFNLDHGSDFATHLMGMPINMDGSEGPRAQSARSLVQNILARRDVPLAFWDERLSTAAAERTLLEADTSRARREEVIDKLAAAWILQGAIDRLNDRR